jgi:hypothetical protein
MTGRSDSPGAADQRSPDPRDASLRAAPLALGVGMVWRLPAAGAVAPQTCGKAARTPARPGSRGVPGGYDGMLLDVAAGALLFTQQPGSDAFLRNGIHSQSALRDNAGLGGLGHRPTDGIQLVDEADRWARASGVLPVPGVPMSSTPLRHDAPRRVYLAGSSSKSTISRQAPPWPLRYRPRCGVHQTAWHALRVRARQRCVGLRVGGDSSRHSPSRERRVARYSATMPVIPTTRPVKTPITVNRNPVWI